jgi:di/tricarboxylate transporter
VSIELFSILLLLLMFVAAAIKPINLGVMGIVAAFLLGTIGGGLTVDEIFGGFPGDLFILLTGVTLLFAIAQSNGTTGLLVQGGLRLIGGNVGLMPWVMFAIAAAFTTVGAVTPAAVAIAAPIALKFADRHNINPFLMGILVVQGANAGAFSPINPFAVIANGVLQARDLSTSPGLLFFYCFVFNLVLAGVVYVVFGGVRLLGMSPAAEGAPAASIGITSGIVPSSSSSPDSAEDDPEDIADEQEGGLTWYRAATLAGILVLTLLTTFFDVDVGFGAITIALVLLVISPSEQERAFTQMPWSAILLVTGIVTYVSVLESIGTFDYVEGAIAAVGSPALAALAASYVGGVISAFASTTAMLGALIPLAAPILEDPAVPALGVVTAIALASSVVDTSPFSTNGALLLANVQNVDGRVFFKWLLYWGILITALVPLTAWALFVVIGGLIT